MRSRLVRGVAFALLCCALCRSAGETRYHQHCKKAKGSGGAVRLLATARFGSAGCAEIARADLTAEGTIVAAGNAWGPPFPNVPGLVVIGEDRPVDTSPFRDPGKKQLDEDHPGMAGFVIELARIDAPPEKAIRFGWGAATMASALIAGDGTSIVSGRCSPEFRQWLGDSPSAPRPRIVAPPEGAKASGADLYLGRVSLREGRLAWIAIFEKAERPSAAWERRVGRRPGIHAVFRSSGDLAFVAYDRLFAIGTNGENLRELAPTRGGVLWAADPRDGSCYVGGDENTNTGREPWRRPFLRKFDADGKLAWEIWRWDSKLVGEDRYRLVSDSSVRSIVPRPDGDLLIAGWSDGGNSVFFRQPKNLDEQASYKKGFIDSLWGAGVGTFMRIMRINGATQAFDTGTVWCSFLTERNKPNSIGIDGMAVLDDGRVAVVGRSATALVETPDAWERAFPKGASGAYLALFSPDLGDLLFSSVMPDVEGKLSLGVRGTKAIIAGSARMPAGSPEPGLNGFLALVELGK